MDIDDAARFRRQAEVCREKSSKSRELVDAASWLRLADDFEKLATQGEGCGRRQARSPCERPDRRLYQSYGSRAQLQSVLFRQEWPNSSPGGPLVRR